MSANRRRSLLGLVAAALVGVTAVHGVGWWADLRLGPQAAAAARPGDILMIGSVTCVYCAAARRWLVEHRVPFDECLIERDPACASAYAALRSPGTPVLLVRDQRLLGFDPRDIARALSTGATRSPPSS
ncbi:MAG: glutaredoxin family protein [Pseudomonadota bacterium]|nr:glutaredoxin family protein [Pseudomonadota bacterium]